MPQARLESNNRHVLNEAFSLPVFQAEDVADYAPILQGFLKFYCLLVKAGKLPSGLDHGDRGVIRLSSGLVRDGIQILFGCHSASFR